VSHTAANDQGVVITSVGSAGARAAGALAAGLGLPLEAAAAAIFRAPTTVASGLSPAASHELATLMRKLGLVAEVVSDGCTVLPGRLLDVAAVIVDATRIDAAVSVLADMLGMAAEQAIELLVTPPGVILGGVSEATVDALRARLPEGVLRLVTADPAISRYALFAAGLARNDEALLEAELGQRPTAVDGGVVAFGLSRSHCDGLWRRFARHGGLRIVHEAFLLYDIELSAVEADHAGAAAALQRLAQVPAAALPALLQLLPVTIEEDLGHNEIGPRLQAYAESGLQVTARLSSFDNRVLELVTAPPAARALLRLTGSTRPPLRLPPLGAARARVLRARLEATGAEVVQAKHAPETRR